MRPKSTDLRLSDCKPILASNGDILWYVTDNTRPILYSLNPYSEQVYLADAKIPMILRTCWSAISWGFLYSVAEKRIHDLGDLRVDLAVFRHFTHNFDCL